MASASDRLTGVDCWAMATAGQSRSPTVINTRFMFVLARCVVEVEPPYARVPNGVSTCDTCVRLYLGRDKPSPAQDGSKVEAGQPPARRSAVRRREGISTF